MTKSTLGLFPTALCLKYFSYQEKHTVELIQVMQNKGGRVSSNLGFCGGFGCWRPSMLCLQKLSKLWWRWSQWKLGAGDRFMCCVWFWSNQTCHMHLHPYSATPWSSRYQQLVHKIFSLKSVSTTEVRVTVESLSSRPDCSELTAVFLQFYSSIVDIFLFFSSRFLKLGHHIVGYEMVGRWVPDLQRGPESRYSRVLIW